MSSQSEQILRIAPMYIDVFKNRQDIVVDINKFNELEVYYNNLMSIVDNSEPIDKITITYNIHGCETIDNQTRRRTKIHKHIIELQDYGKFKALIIDRIWNSNIGSTDYYFKYNEYLLYYQKPLTNAWGTSIPPIYVLVKGKPSTLISHIRDDLSQGTSVKMTASKLNAILDFLWKEDTKNNTESNDRQSIQKYENTDYELRFHDIDTMCGLNKNHNTYRAIRTTIKDNKNNSMDVVYSRGTYIELDTIAKQLNLGSRYIYHEQGIRIFNLSNRKVYTKDTSKKLYKQLDAMYEQCFPDEVQLDTTKFENWDAYLQCSNNVFAKRNIVLQQKYKEERDKYLEFIGGPYKLSEDVQKYTDDYHGIFGDHSFIFYEPTKRMTNQFNSLLGIDIRRSIGYIAKNKNTKLPVNIILLAEHCDDDDHANTLQAPVRLKDDRKIDGRNFKLTYVSENYNMQYKTLIIEHSKMTGDTVYNISGCNDYKLYNIEDTPKMYVDITMRLLEIMACRIYKGYNRLFGFYGLANLFTETEVEFAYSDYIDYVRIYGYKTSYYMHVRNWNNGKETHRSLIFP